MLLGKMEPTAPKEAGMKNLLKMSDLSPAELTVGLPDGRPTYAGAGKTVAPIQDTARVLGRYYDAIVYRTFKQSDVDALARYSGVPVVSGMTDYAHPLQVLTDLMTVREYKGKLAGLKAGFVGDGYNMANSLIVGCLMMGMDFTIACPNGYRPSADVLFFAREYGDHFKLTTAPDEAARGADVLFTDVWTTASAWMQPAWRWPSRTVSCSIPCPPTAACQPLH